MIDNDQHLLAIDLGLRSGMAVFNVDGRLVWYSSQRYKSMPDMKRAACKVFSEHQHISWLISEGNVALAAIWERVAMRQRVRVQRVTAETWRTQLLQQHDEDSLETINQRTMQLAHRIIRWSGLPQPGVLRQDESEAILIGMWGVITLGWLKEIPQEVNASYHMAKIRLR